MASFSTPSIYKSFKYDVFLSFRGKDTRANFIDHLYYALQNKSIHTYKDDEKIKKGKTISVELIGCIEDSKLYVIVFSKNYASSSWCLDELVKIMEGHKTKEHTAYPVFYDVLPSEVRKQSGAVEKAFAKHENEEAAGKWRMALKEAADLAGWELKNTADGNEAKFIQKIVEELSLELRDIDFNIDEKLVGMETRINDVLSSFGTVFDDVHMIGIKGMGGGGKTTLARAVFDQISFQFEGKSFVENVREVSQASLFGLKSLQNQILSDVINDQGITVRSVYDGKNMMKRRMCCKKVLLVLDDVDHIEQLEALAGDPNWFKPGSRIIITTRDEQVLLAHGIKSIYNIRLLLDEEAICLFNKYAFGRVIPNLRYKVLSQQVVLYAAGLPLTIKVLGSFLCAKNELEWIDALKRLKTIPLVETLKKLEISYIGLEEDYKEIFLNVACIMKGWSKGLAIKALESCGFCPINGLRVLEQKSLITVDNHEYLGMHDHIEEMGRNIVRRSCPDMPNKHSRLWIDEEIKDILANNLGTKATRYLQLYTTEISLEVVMKGLRKMKELRFLHLSLGFTDASKSAYFHWNLKYLQYLSWNHYPFKSLPKTFQAENLVALYMTESRIVQLWEGGERKVLKKLRFLDLSYSMLRTLDLGLAPNIEQLDLTYCSELKELGLSHNCLNLRSLKLSDSKLRTLDMGLTPNLEYLDLKNCYNLKELHMDHESLKKLVYLDLSGCLGFNSFKFHIESDASCNEDELVKVGPLAELYLFAKSVTGCKLHPVSNLPMFEYKCYYKEDQPLLTRNLQRLISIGLCVCTNLDMFSRSICGLERLRWLKLEGSIREVPKDLNHLECLERLELFDTDIEDLPDSICMLKHLKSLEVNNCVYLRRLPEHLGRLECLEKLSLRYCKLLQKMPDSICKMKCLKHLFLNNCIQLEKLPEEFEHLKCIEILDITRTCISHIPQSIFLLKGLRIIGSRGLLQSSGFTSEIQSLGSLNVSYYVDV